MPLIIISGLPCSGKTYRADQIGQEFESRIATAANQSLPLRRRTVVHIPSHHASLDPSSTAAAVSSSSMVPTPAEVNVRDQIYNSAAAEKTARAEEFSAVKRALSKDAVVIADGLNYIKGYRYQLWCEAKAAGTRCCVVHVAGSEKECEKWNRERLRAWGKEEENDDTLGGRRVGKDDASRLGDLVPESHTAVYGDRVVEAVSRSRSSSLDGLAEGEAEDSRPDDGFTLKSLSLHENPGLPSSQINGSLSVSNASSQEPSDPSRSIPKPSAPPPEPNSAYPYSPSTFTSLTMRYEPPSPFSRWDTPLFTIPTSDLHPPYTQIWDALFPPPTRPTSKKAIAQGLAPQPSNTNPPGRRKSNEGAVEDVKQHAATVLPQTTSADALQLLESATQAVVSRLLPAARSLGVADGDGGLVEFDVPAITTSTAISSSSTFSSNNPNNTNAKLPAAPPSPQEHTTPPLPSSSSSSTITLSITIPPGTPLSQPQLQRLRRKYTQIQRGAIAHGKAYQGGGREGAVRAFVRFLEAEWEEG